jgi:hypothetical protein
MSTKTQDGPKEKTKCFGGVQGGGADAWRVYCSWVTIGPFLHTSRQL